MRRLLVALVTALHLLTAPAHGQEAVAKPSTEVLAQDLREEVLRFEATVTDMFGRQETKPVPVTVYRPQGDGPFPLFVFNHGRAIEAKRAQQGRYRPESMARYLVAKGFVVMVPNRIGYWETYGGFDPEFSGCRSIEPMSIAASDQVLATVAFARSLPYVDTSRWLVGGVSVGGLTSVATVGRAPEGLLGGINFSGGTGGNPEANPSKPCNPSATSQYWGRIAKNAKVPMVWLYWENDKFWGANNPKLWHQAWQDGGGQAQFAGLDAVGEDGHGGVNLDMDRWLPVVDQFLQTLGFDAPAIVQMPPPSSFAAITDLGAVPAGAAGVRRRPDGFRLRLRTLHRRPAGRRPRRSLAELGHGGRRGPHAGGGAAASDRVAWPSA
jgi:dienelactone hydrolase